MSEMNEFIARLYNNDYSYAEIRHKIQDRFGTELSVEAVQKRIKRMKDSGTLDCEEQETVGNSDILSEIEEKAGGPMFRIGVLDCETTGLWADFGYLLVAVIKDMETGEHQVFRLDECESYKDTSNLAHPSAWRRIDRELLEKIRDAYEDYDIIIHFNGRNFDIKFLNTRLIKNHLKVLPEMKQMDIYQIAKHRLRLRSKKLDALKEFLEIDETESGHKWEYWQMAAARIPAGFDFVVEHCKRDVDRLAEVARRMKILINYIKK